MTAGYAAFERIVRDMRFPPDMRVDVGFDPPRGYDSGISIGITYRTLDAIPYGQPVAIPGGERKVSKVGDYKKVPMSILHDVAAGNADVAVHWIYSMVQSLWLHEFREWTTYQGKHVVEPHPKPILDNPTRL